MLGRSVDAKRRSRATVALILAGSLAVPALALAGSVNDKIPDGFYATVVGVRHVPTGADVEFTLHGHSYAAGLAYVCAPSTAVAPLVADSGYSNIITHAENHKLPLRNGNFSYSATGKVTSGYAGAPTVATAKLVIKGTYVRHGRTYHYKGSLDNAVSATLVFEGTASSTACANPKPARFYLYRTTSTGGE